jgi:hypothetical protein
VRPSIGHAGANHDDEELDECATCHKGQALPGSRSRRPFAATMISRRPNLHKADGASTRRLARTVLGATTLDPSSSSLVDPAVSEFIEAVSELAVVGRLPCRPAPLNVRVISQASGATGSWRTEGKAKPLRSAAYAASIMRAKVVQALVVVSDDMLRHATVAAEQLIRNDLTRATMAALDTAFLDDQNVGDAATPTSVTYDVTPVSGSADKSAPLKAVVADFAGSLERAWWIGRPEIFASLSGAAIRMSGSAAASSSELPPLQRATRRPTR